MLSRYGCREETDDASEDEVEQDVCDMWIVAEWWNCRVTGQMEGPITPECSPTSILERRRRDHEERIQNERRDRQRRRRQQRQAWLVRIRVRRARIWSPSTPSESEAGSDEASSSTGDLTCPMETGPPAAHPGEPDEQVDEGRDKGQGLKEGKGENKYVKKTGSTEVQSGASSTDEVRAAEKGTASTMKSPEESKDVHKKDEESYGEGEDIRQKKMRKK